MQFQNSAQSYLRPVANNVGVRQQVRSRVRSVPLLDISLMQAFGRVFLLLAPLVLVINIGLASVTHRLDKSLAGLEDQRHQLTDKKIELLAKRAELLLPANLEQLAAERLELYRAEPGQVAQFDYRKHVFRYR